jgi:hypothetical protein
MAEIEGFEEFEDVEADVEVGKFGIECFEFGVLEVSQSPYKRVNFSKGVGDSAENSTSRRAGVVASLTHVDVF